MARNRKCICCLTEYEYCPVCKEYQTFPKWKTEFDTEACKELFNIISAYNMGLADKSAVKNVLDQYNITDYSKYKDSIKNKLNTLFSETTQSVVDEVVEEPKYDFSSSRRNKFKRTNIENEANTEE